MSQSVAGEVYRYARRFEKAWQAYAEAEQIFQRAAELALDRDHLPAAGDLPPPGGPGRVDLLPGRGH